MKISGILRCLGFQSVHELRCSKPKKTMQQTAYLHSLLPRSWPALAETKTGGGVDRWEFGSTRRPGKRQRNLQGANMELSGSSALCHRQSAPDAPCTYVLSCDRRPWHTANDLLIPLLPAIALAEFRRNGAANYCVFYPCTRDRRNNMATRYHFGFVWLCNKEVWPKFGSLSKLG